ncbi:hypothetical protein ACI1US_01650 [Leucobacter sp. BZR 635]
MESASDTASASAQLEEIARIQRDAQGRSPARGYWLLQLWSAVIVAGYLGAYLLMHGGFTATEVSNRDGGYATPWTFVVLVLTFSSLASGVRERFSVQSRQPLLQRLVNVVGILGFAALLALSFADISYPNWLNAALPLAMLVGLGARPLRKLITVPRDPAEVWGNAPLPAPVRITTAGIGLAIGALLATASSMLASAVSGFVVMLCLGMLLLAQNSRFGLPRAGFEWGSLHWSVFGVCAAIAAASVTLGSLTAWFSQPYTVISGVVVFLLMSAAAVLPRGSSPAEA